MQVRVGCCGWPVARARYFLTFPLVEVQESFYNLPRLATVERWRAAAPAGFEFVLKAPQLITHEPTSPTYRRLRTPLTETQKRRYGAFKATREVRAVWCETLALARVLRSRIVIFQCPASFTATPGHIRNLSGFFERAERGGLAFAWEPRGEWPDAEVKALCKRLDLIHCVDPFQRRPVWGEPAYLRLHGKGGYHYTYSDGELKDLLALVEALGACYVLFNNTEMFDDARRFRGLWEQTFGGRRERVAG
jgi:uncharacterized protein YecE (DUF72 family)